MLAADAGESGEAGSEVELRALMADEVEHRQDGFACAASQSSAELLKEHCRALRRAQHKERVDVGNVDALVEDVDCEQATDRSAPKVGKSLRAFGTRCVGRDGG